MADPRAKRKGALIPREQAPTIDARYLVNGVSRHDLSSGAASVAWAAVTGKPSVNTTSPLSGGGSLASSLTLTTSMATSRLIGRTTAGTGVMEQLTVTSPLALGTGTLTTTMATARLIGRYSAGTGVMQEITIGSGLSLSGAGALSATGATVADGDYGDIVVSGAGTSWLLDSTIAGTAGGRTIYGGNAANDDLHLYSTSHATKGYVYVYDDLVIGTAGTEAGGVSINGTNYEAICGVHDIGGARAASLHLHRHSTTLQNYLLATRSATEDDTHAALTNADVILTLMAAACTGTHYDQSASIEFLVGAGTVSGTSSPGRIRFRTTPDGSQTPTTRLDILANGQINTSDGLDVGGTLTAQTGTSTTAGLLKLGATGGAQAYGVAPSVLAAYVLAPVSALSLGTDYELCQDGAIIRKPIGDFGSSDPPTNWSKDNAASGTFSSSGGVYTIANTTASASNSWYGGTHTTPAIYRLCTGVRGVIQVTHRIQITAHTTNGDSADFGFCRGSALGYIDAVVDVSRTGANAFKMDMWTDNGTQLNIFSGKTSAEAATGWWVRFWIDTNTGYWRMEYATGSGSIPADSAWTHGGFGLATNMRSNAVYLFAHARKAAGAGTAGTTATHWLAEERIWRFDHAGGAYVPLGGCGYTASTAVTTHDDCWVGTLGDSALNAAVQAMLTAALNQRPGDGATWEVAVLRSTTAGGYGAATWTGTGAVACTGTGAYVRVQLRATGTTTQGSVQIARLTAPIAA